MTEPRAARRGQKVSGVSNSSMPNVPSDSLSPTPTPPVLNGPIDLSSFLAEVSTTTATATSSSSAAAATSSSVLGTSSSSTGTISSGVVRGRARDHASAVKEKDPSTTQSEVETKLREQFKQLQEQESSSSGTSSGGSGEDNDSWKQINSDSASITLMSDSALSKNAMNLLQQDEKSRILVVSSLEKVLSCRKDFEQEVPSNKNISIGFWCGSEKNLSSSSSTVKEHRLWYTTFRDFVSFLSVYVRKCSSSTDGDHTDESSSSSCPFTHIFLVAKEGKLGPLFDASLAVLSSLLSNSNNTTCFHVTGKRSAPKVILCGVNSVEDVQRTLGDLPVQSLSKVSKHKPIIFTPSDSAALAGTIVKEHSPSSISLRRLPGVVSSLPQSLCEHGISVGVSVLNRAITLAASQKFQMIRCAVISAELTDLESSINQALPANTFTCYHEARDFLAHGTEEDVTCLKSNKRIPILLLSRASSDATASQLKLHFVVDCGTERRAQIPPQAEMQFPIKVILAPSKREFASRQKMAGWLAESSGIFFSTVEFASLSNNSTNSTTTSASSPVIRGDTTTTSTSSTTTGGVTEIDDGDEDDLLEPVCDAILSLAQNGLDVSNLVHEQRKGRDAQLQLAIPFLTDLGYITSPPGEADKVVTTFLGEIVSRTGLAPDFALIVVHGLVCGLGDASAFVATAASRPFRQSPAGSSAVSATHSPASTTQSTSVNAGTSGFSASSQQQQQQTQHECGDVIEDAMILADGVAANLKTTEEITAFCSSRYNNNNTNNNIRVEAFEHALHIVHIIQAGISDFVTNTRLPDDASSSGNIIRRQLYDNANLFVAFIAAALARRAVVVRHEGDDRINSVSRGNLLFTHTAKEVVPNRFIPTAVPWRKDMVIVCSSIQNTATRLLGSGGTAVSNDYFMGALFALAPSISYDSTVIQSSNQVSFSIQLNRLEKTSLVDQSAGDTLLNLRDKWRTLVSYVQIRRATGAKTPGQYRDAIAKYMDKRFVLEREQNEFVAELCEFIADFHVTVPLGNTAIGRDPARVKNHFLNSPPPPSSLTSIAVPSDYAVAQEIALMDQKQQPSTTTTITTTEEEKQVKSATSASETIKQQPVLVEEDVDEEEAEGIIIDDD